jgi:hypothetical protein
MVTEVITTASTKSASITCDVSRVSCRYARQLQESQCKRPRRQLGGVLAVPKARTSRQPLLRKSGPAGRERVIRRRHTILQNAGHILHVVDRTINVEDNIEQDNMVVRKRGTEMEMCTSRNEDGASIGLCRHDDSGAERSVLSHSMDERTLKRVERQGGASQLGHMTEQGINRNRTPSAVYMFVSGKETDIEAEFFEGKNGQQLLFIGVREESTSTGASREKLKRIVDKSEPTETGQWRK